MTNSSVTSLLSLFHAVDGVAVVRAHEAEGVNINGISLDSRTVAVGNLYLALGGALTHGLVHARSAIENGAVAVALDVDDVNEHGHLLPALRDTGAAIIELEGLSDNVAELAACYYDDPSRSMTIIAVTGTDGKTSVCQFVAESLTALGHPCGYIGTLGWGLIDTLRVTTLTTPDAVSLQSMLAQLRAEGARSVAIEASSHGLDQGRFDRVRVDVAVLTNIGRDHLDYHETLDNYRAAKARLFSLPGVRSRVLNGCDDLGVELLDTYRHQVGTIAYGQPGTDDTDHDTSLQVIAASPELTANGLAFVLHDSLPPSLDTASEANVADSDTVSSHVSSSLFGRFNIDNLLACYSVMRVMGHAANDASLVLGDIRAVAGRMERFSVPGRPAVVVDYAHTPQALDAALAAARSHCTGELWVVFGCGGDRDTGKRAPMGRAAEAADHVVVTDDNPRTEESALIIDAIVAGMRDPGRATIINDRSAAIEHALRHASANDIVLVAGKGHEDYQIIGRERIDYSDRDLVGRLLREAS